ncbi:hypothetical protein RAA17_03250 [Komagataeibacter rhaeticus]|nr:hypothetical protein [Komagataeibacter rhaeticus]
MFAHTLTQELLRVLERPDLRVIAGGRQIMLDPALDLPFRILPGGAIVLGLPAQGQQEETAFFLRHALELAPLLELAPHNALCAAFCAARTAALFWYLDTGRADTDAPAAWVPEMARADVPTPGALRLIWPLLAPLQPAPDHDVASDSFVALHARLLALWSMLGPTENLMATGATPGWPWMRRPASTIMAVRTGPGHGPSPLRPLRRPRCPNGGLPGRRRHGCHCWQVHCRAGAMPRRASLMATYRPGSRRISA